MLYDLETDPYELKNLIQDADSAGLRSGLDRRLLEWMRKTKDSWNFDWTEPVEDKGRLYRFQAFYTVEEYFKWAAAHPDPVPRN